LKNPHRLLLVVVVEWERRAMAMILEPTRNITRGQMMNEWRNTVFYRHTTLASGCLEGEDQFPESLRGQ
jgi:hypothetical protein